MTNSGSPICEALKCVGLTAYEKDLRAHGCKSFEALLHLTDNDLQQVGMKPPQRRKLLLWTAFLRQYTQNHDIDDAIHGGMEVSGMPPHQVSYPSEESHVGTMPRGVPTSLPSIQQNSYPTTSTAQSQAQLTKVRLCTTFGKKGACHFGSHCKFAHTKGELRVDPRDGLIHDKYVQFERVIKELSVQPMHSCVVFGDYLSVDQHQAVYTAAKKYQLRTRSFGQNADRCVVVYKGELSGETHPCLRVYGTCAYGQQCTWSSFPRELCLRCLKDRSHSEHQCDNTCDLEALMHSTKDAAELCQRVENFLKQLQESPPNGCKYPVEVLAFKMALSGQQRKVVFWKAKMLGLTPVVCGTPPHCGIIVLPEPCPDLPTHPCHRVYGKCNFKKCIFEPFPRVACLRCLKGKAHETCDTQCEFVRMHNSPMLPVPHGESAFEHHAMCGSCSGHDLSTAHLPQDYGTAMTDHWQGFDDYPTSFLGSQASPQMRPQRLPSSGMPSHSGLGGLTVDSLFPSLPMDFSVDEGYDPSLDITANMDINKLLVEAEEEMSQLMKGPEKEMTASPLEDLGQEDYPSRCWERFTMVDNDASFSYGKRSTTNGNPSVEDPSSCDILLNSMLSNVRSARTAAPLNHHTTA